MLFHSLLPQALLLAQITDYGGGTNPLLIYLFFGGIGLIILSAIAFSAWKVYQRIQFGKVCAAAGIKGEEYGFLRNFIKFARVRDPLGAVTERAQFDRFVNSVVRAYDASPLLTGDIIREAKIFSSIRKKLDLPHKFNFKKLTSSRALPPGQTLHLKCKDPDTKKTFSFKVKVLKNTELMLGITPPDDYTREQVLSMHRPELEVAFTRDQDAKYWYLARIVRTEEQGEESAWYISHSEALVRGEEQQKLDIPVSIIATGSEDEGFVECDGTIRFFTKENCVVEIVNAPFKNGSYIIMDFKVGPHEVNCQASITEVHENMIKADLRSTKPKISEVLASMKKG